MRLRCERYIYVDKVYNRPSFPKQKMCYSAALVFTAFLEGSLKATAVSFSQNLNLQFAVFIYQSSNIMIECQKSYT